MEIESPLSPLATNYWFANLETLFILAVKNKDIEALEAMTDDRFLAVGLHGRLYNKTEMLHLIDTTGVYDTLDLIDVTVIRENGFAITISELNVKLWFDRVQTTGLIRVTRVWVERANGWKVISYQVAAAQKGESWRAAREKFSKP